jgi:hypothetical protein
LMFGITVSSISAFAISYSTSWCVRMTGATTYRYRPFNLVWSVL